MYLNNRGSSILTFVPIQYPSSQKLLGVHFYMIFVIIFRCSESNLMVLEMLFAFNDMKSFFQLGGC